PGVAGGGSELLDLHVLLIGLAAAVLSSTIPYILETEALRRMPARIFSVMMSLEPAAAAVIGLVVLGQLLSLREAVAVAMVVIAGIGVTRGGEAPPPQAAIEA
ncbi:MAG: EamA family transporter, partial [Solirubrobacterales bacterium]